MTDTSKKNDKKNIVLYGIIFSLIIILIASILIYYYNVYSSPLKTFISMPVISQPQSQQQQPRAPPPIQDIHRTAAAISAVVI